MFSSTLLPDIPTLKLKKMQEPLHLGDSMRITGLHENGFLAQLNGSIEVLLIPGSYDRNASSEDDDNDESPPPSHRSLPPPSTRKSPPPLAFRSHSQPSPSRTFETFNGDMRLSPRGTSSPCLPVATLCPRHRAKTTNNKDPATTNPSPSPSSCSSSPASPRGRMTTSSQVSPRSSPTLPPHPPPIPFIPVHSSQRNVVKPVQRSPSYNYIPLQGWVLWRRSIGQWESIWLASKKSPTRLCFFTSESEDSEETDSIKIDSIKSLWAPEESSVDFDIVKIIKRNYHLQCTSGLQKLIPDLEIDMRENADPASPLSPRQPNVCRSRYELSDNNDGLNGDSYSTEEDTEDEWAL